MDTKLLFLFIIGVYQALDVNEKLSRDKKEKLSVTLIILGGFPLFIHLLIWIFGHGPKIAPIFVNLMKMIFMDFYPTLNNYLYLKGKHLYCSDRRRENYFINDDYVLIKVIEDTEDESEVTVGKGREFHTSMAMDLTDGRNTMIYSARLTDVLSLEDSNLLYGKDVSMSVQFMKMDSIKFDYFHSLLFFDLKVNVYYNDQGNIKIVKSYVDSQQKEIFDDIISRRHFEIFMTVMYKTKQKELIGGTRRSKIRRCFVHHAVSIQKLLKMVKALSIRNTLILKSDNVKGYVEDSISQNLNEVFSNLTMKSVEMVNPLVSDLIKAWDLCNNKPLIKEVLKILGSGMCQGVNFDLTNWQSKRFNRDLYEVLLVTNYKMIKHFYDKKLKITTKCKGVIEKHSKNDLNENGLNQEETENSKPVAVKVEAECEIAQTKTTESRELEIGILTPKLYEYLERLKNHVGEKGRKYNTAKKTALDMTEKVYKKTGNKGIFLGTKYENMLVELEIKGIKLKELKEVLNDPLPPSMMGFLKKVGHLNSYRDVCKRNSGSVLELIKQKMTYKKYKMNDACKESLNILKSKGKAEILKIQSSCKGKRNVKYTDIEGYVGFVYNTKLSHKENSERNLKKLDEMQTKIDSKNNGNRYHALKLADSFFDDCVEDGKIEIFSQITRAELKDFAEDLFKQTNVLNKLKVDKALVRKGVTESPQGGGSKQGIGESKNTMKKGNCKKRMNCVVGMDKRYFRRAFFGIGTLVKSTGKNDELRAMLNRYNAPLKEMWSETGERELKDRDKESLRGLLKRVEETNFDGRKKMAEEQMKEDEKYRTSRKHFKPIKRKMLQKVDEEYEKTTLNAMLSLKYLRYFHVNDKIIENKKLKAN